ncbi:MAG: methyltransferase family protein [Vulcanimicrobiaceae bacterium]
MQSPAWYRARGFIIAMIYLAGFILGSWMAQPFGLAHMPAFAWIGLRFGSLGPLYALAFATLCMFACFALRAWGSAYLSAPIVWNADANTDTLLVDGPFRFVRNPLYLGNLFMALGFALIATPPGAAIILVGNSLFVAKLSRYESGAMRERFGSLYEVYAREVPSFVPRLTPAYVAGSARGTPLISQGLRSEIFAGTAAFAMALLFILGSRAIPAFYGMLIVGWIVQSFQTRALSA